MQTLVGSDILATRLVQVTDDVQTGKNARAAREQARLSLREVARRLGVSPAYVCDLEKGRRPWNMQRAVRYATAVRSNDQVENRL